MGTHPQLRAIAIVAVAVGGCCGTDIGCIGGLYVAFKPAHAGRVRVEVLDPASNPPRFFECDPYPVECSNNGASFPDFTPRSVTFRISTATASRDVTVRPNYNTSAPNGMFCGPKCRGATVELPVP